MERNGFTVRLGASRYMYWSRMASLMKKIVGQYMIF